jgi:predicted NUDIX family phosphoesterase
VSGIGKGIVIMNKYNEEVLCFSASLLALNPDKALIEKEEVVIDYYNKIILNPKNLIFIDRNKAEINEDWKQLIPYVVLKFKDEVFSYTRTKRAGETRLHDKKSIGIGGHINPVDSTLNYPDKFNYYTAMWRELNEEVEIVTPSYSPVDKKVKALIYDPTTPVGRVHFGIVHILDFDWKPEVKCKEDALTDGAFRPILEVKNEQSSFESWSQFILREVL